MAFKDLNSDYRKRLELHKKNGEKSGLSIHQVARIMDGIRAQERNEYPDNDVLINYRVCLN
ncbi:MAG: hypothetical protein R2799_13680 [Crocinitomicaceae bacterium]